MPMNFIDINLMKKNSNRWFFAHLECFVWSLAGSTNTPDTGWAPSIRCFFVRKCQQKKMTIKKKQWGTFIFRALIFRGELLVSRSLSAAIFGLQEVEMFNESRRDVFLTKKNMGDSYTQAIAHSFFNGTYG